jgi:outer membrane receptor for Fe3+-dicitrate
MLNSKAALLSTSLLLSVISIAPGAWAQALPADAGAGSAGGVGEENTNDDILVFGRAEPQIGIAFASSEGRVGRADFETRPLLRVGELLEVVPGLIATQHSGPGKANQFFLRGFNLDHGTDFAGFFDGVPLNLRTHGHGQGYLDLNPIIP